MNNMMPEEVFRIFRSVFGGRASAFTTHFTTPSGKEGYRRVCSRMGKQCTTESFPDCGRCRSASLLHLSAEALGAHLDGRFPVGIYPADENGCCRFSVIELENEDFRPRLRLLAAICKSADLAHLCELTHFGQRGRLWLFYREPVTARLAAETAADLLLESQIAMGGLPVDTGDNIFPVISPPSDFGKPVMLPLFDIKSGFSVFTDDELKPVSDGLELLANIAPNEIKSVRLPVGNDDFPPTVRVEICDKIYVSAQGFSPRGIAALCDLARMHNPESSSESGDARPVFVGCFGFSNGRVHLPAGVIDGLRGLLDPYSKVEITDGRQRGDKIRLRSSEKSDTQLVKRLLLKDRAVITAPVGSGKTQLIFGVMESLRRSTLILTTEKSAAVRWRRRTMGHFGLGEDDIPCITDDLSYPGGRLDVALLGPRTELWLAEHLPRYGLVIAADVDRLHCGGDIFRSVMENICAEKVYAVSSCLVENTRWGD